MVNLKSISNESTQSYVGAVCNPPPLHSTRFQVRNSFTKHMHRRKKARTWRASARCGFNLRAEFFLD